MSSSIDSCPYVVQWFRVPVSKTIQIPWSAHKIKIVQAVEVCNWILFVISEVLSRRGIACDRCMFEYLLLLVLLLIVEAYQDLKISTFLHFHLRREAELKDGQRVTIPRAAQGWQRVIFKRIFNWLRATTFCQVQFAAFSVWCRHIDNKTARISKVLFLSTKPNEVASGVDSARSNIYQWRMGTRENLQFNYPPCLKVICCAMDLHHKTYFETRNPLFWFKCFLSRLSTTLHRRYRPKPVASPSRLTPRWFPKRNFKKFLICSWCWFGNKRFRGWNHQIHNKYVPFLFFIFRNRKLTRCTRCGCSSSRSVS